MDDDDDFRSKDYPGNARTAKKQRKNVKMDSVAGIESEDANSPRSNHPKTADRRIRSMDNQRSMFSWVTAKSGERGSKEPSPTRSEDRRRTIQSPDFSTTAKKARTSRFCGQSAMEMGLKALEVIDIEDDDDEAVRIVEPAKKEPKVQRHHKITIRGVDVEMPVKPYLCQEQVMAAIIDGSTNQHNCLLESPTGSGKTLALLCATLAWQMQFRKKLDAANAAEKISQEAASLKSSNAEIPIDKQTGANCCEVDEMNVSLIDGDWSDDDVADYKQSNDKEKVPAIYYGSRTHRQIGQVIRELDKTVYRDIRMTLLSSRDFSCIQDTTRSKNEVCAELLDPEKSRKNGGCPYYNEHNKMTIGSYSGLAKNGIQGPWEIEDLVSAGKTAGACPYFAARTLMQDAEIIFCPYNYLVDPAIRENLSIDIRGAIIILDEAHNIEDCCREAGSVSITDTSLEGVLTDCGNVLEFAAAKKKLSEVNYVATVENYCARLRKFIDSTMLKDQQGSYDGASGEKWTGVELLAMLEINEISKEINSSFLRAGREAIRIFNTARENQRLAKIDDVPRLSADTIRTVEKIIMGLTMLTSGHVVDYRAVVKQVSLGFKKEKSLELICMNPNVIFGPMSELARSIILASGTLAPTSSFTSELGAKFPFLIQADHVTPPEQICIKCVTVGSNGKSLKGTYQNINTWDFQDEVGSILLTTCRNVEHGILMFFSSYTTMKTLINRWDSNGMLQKITETKEIFQETRGSADLPTMMRNYREVIRNTSNGPVENINGAVLFAVFRGKVAEGIDFSDNEARAVLTVGIPFAARNDPAVDMKYRYNDENKGKGLLSGYDWYTVQAFRALNQAIGRAIRHQNDWAAIILIDERFREMRNVNLLPTWVRSMLTKQSQLELSQMLQSFVARQRKREREANVRTSEKIDDPNA